MVMGAVGFKNLQGLWQPGQILVLVVSYKAKKIALSQNQTKQTAPKLLTEQHLK